MSKRLNLHLFISLFLYFLLLAPPNHVASESELGPEFGDMPVRLSAPLLRAYASILHI